jgi:hypothetical protein
MRFRLYRSVSDSAERTPCRRRYVRFFCLSVGDNGHCRHATMPIGADERFRLKIVQRCAEAMDGACRRGDICGIFDSRMGCTGARMTLLLT